MLHQEKTLQLHHLVEYGPKLSETVFKKRRVFNRETKLKKVTFDLKNVGNVECVN